MLSSKFVKAPVLNLRPSRILAVYTILGHLIALSVLFYPMTIPVSARLLIAIAVVISFMYHWRTREVVLALRAPHGDDLWLLQLKDGREVDATLYGEYTVTGWLIVLRYKLVKGGKLTIVILPDSEESEAIRCMRVYLRQLKMNA